MYVHVHVHTVEPLMKNIPEVRTAPLIKTVYAVPIEGVHNSVCVCVCVCVCSKGCVDI